MKIFLNFEIQKKFWIILETLSGNFEDKNILQCDRALIKFYPSEQPLSNVQRLKLT